jgi:hypothetical protein
MKESKFSLLLVIAHIFLYNNAKDVNTIALKKVPQKPILKKPSIFHIKNFVPTNTYKFLKNDRNLLKNQKKNLKFLKKLFFWPNIIDFISKTDLIFFWKFV